MVLSLDSGHKRALCCRGRHPDRKSRVVLAPALWEHILLLLEAALVSHKEVEVHMEVRIFYCLARNRGQALDNRALDMDSHSYRHNMA